MSRTNLQDMTVQQLVQRFLAIALEQHEALSLDEYERYNRLYDQMAAVTVELRARAGDRRKALVPLLDHSNARVRLKAAINTLAVAPEAARRTLQAIVDRKEYPEAADARGMLRALERGTYSPT